MRADLAFIYEGGVAEAFRDCPSRPDFLGAWLVQAGEAKVTQDGRTVRATAGEWIVMRQAAGRQVFSADARILSIRFQAEWPDRKPFFELGLSTVLPAAGFPELEERGRALLAAVRGTAPTTPVDLRVNPVALETFITIKLRFWEWLAAMIHALDEVGIHPTRTTLKDERMVEVVHQLDRLPLSTHLREDDLAKGVGLQVGQFVRVFRREVGTTPKRYFDERRRDACRRLLSGTDTPIKEIALELGYLRLSDFSAWFSAHQGMSPREFRKVHRDGERASPL